MSNRTLAAAAAQVLAVQHTWQSEVGSLNMAACARRVFGGNAP